MNFSSLEQRVIHTYLDTFPDFIPAPSASVSEQGQKQFYDFMRHVYDILMERPDLLFAKTHGDDAHTNRFNKRADGKPELTNTLRRSQIKVEELITTMFRIGEAGRLIGSKLVIGSDLKISRSHLSVLEEAGIITVKEEDGNRPLFHAQKDELMPAWKWMASKPGASVLAFSRCMFDSERSYPRGIYERLSGDEAAFRALVEYLEANGYARIDNRDHQVALDYVKNYDRKDMPVKDAWAERTHAGISAKYDPHVKQPAYFCLRVPKMKEVLGRFDSMDDEVKSFVVASNKKCDGCNYCTQTDKTGERGHSSIIVSHNGKEYELCLLFPGFYYCWVALDEGLVSGMIRYLRFIDETLIT
ncbi:hypothetical protein [Gorillibacterium massiliense]|uniref:hypothetical protein n=1 Tax=Gorillibacterium massiliense TaxID=1280390 RepID=UPI0004B0260F|nr:hypothetical protein [Gorillibacterium massiliense]